MVPFTSNDVKTRTFCCCIPARLGTLALATLSILISVTLALQATTALFQDNFVNGFMVWVCLLECVLWWSLALICVYGKSKKPLLLWWHLWLNVVLGVYGIIIFSLPAAKEYRAMICTATGMIDVANDLPDGQLLTSQHSSEIALKCVALVKKHLLLIDFAFVIGILLELYSVLMVAHFLDELADREAADKYGVDIEAATPPYKLE
ncbi:uncharacterized protein JCM15063_005166 [Sporobolomyces koalae]|uniref:uncharacterized protein n=1 Tax=Sporobolomyces koalae TaxID=500713 RepID=UPI00317AE56E